MQRRNKPLAPTRRQSPFAPPCAETVALARNMYAEGFTVSRILARCDMSLGTLYYWLDGGPREAGGPALPPVPRRRVVLGKRRRPLAGDAHSLQARLYRTAERQVRDIELRLARADLAPSERERDTRMLGQIVRTLRDLTQIALHGGEEVSAPAPQDADAMRRELGRRIDALVAQAKAAHPDD